MVSIEEKANQAASAFRYAAALLLDAANLLNEFALRAKRHEAVMAGRAHQTCTDPACPSVGKHQVPVDPGRRTNPIFEGHWSHNGDLT